MKHLPSWPSWSLGLSGSSWGFLSAPVSPLFSPVFVPSPGPAPLYTLPFVWSLPGSHGRWNCVDPLSLNSKPPYSLQGPLILKVAVPFSRGQADVASKTSSPTFEMNGFTHTLLIYKRVMKWYYLLALLWRLLLLLLLNPALGIEEMLKKYELFCWWWLLLLLLCYFKCLLNTCRNRLMQCQGLGELKFIPWP